ncbi:uncharacterized protein SCHCODRAFT_01170283 [Schizophyllum commune H4-8]|uniref:Expressed protein n=1 Tax=Schizophyllum commune (strain H4-8 / FGSC 9210) TaxID=578458 RepID=D8PYQ0_SCHCM|nr:uncharacterized protein SCHCODRAFT_01170283 [Schizophyllum commune H4-8]KAI5896071.1 hypothetical protein SCHCODRAFT_01170283 [Schizophyllum commune H4-8]
MLRRSSHSRRRSYCGEGGRRYRAFDNRVSRPSPRPALRRVLLRPHVQYGLQRYRYMRDFGQPRVRRGPVRQWGRRRQRHVQQVRRTLTQVRSG